jgi:hypothetical protein
MSTNGRDAEKPASSRARDGWRRAPNGGLLRPPFEKGKSPMVGYRKPSTYIETLHLARKSSPAAMRTLISRLNDPDGRIAVMAASLILERAFGRPKEQVPHEERAQIDLTKLTAAELQILIGLADSGRLTSAPSPSPGDDAPTIDAEAEPPRGERRCRG